MEILWIMSSSNEGTPLMPRAVAVWLVDNTALTFEQIAEFCGLHLLEVKGIADGEVAKGVVGCNPVAMGQVTKEEIEACQKDPTRIPKLVAHRGVATGKLSRRRGARYTPVARRRDKPDAVCWILKYCAEMHDSQIAKLIGTTKATIAAVRNKEHWNSSNIKPRDPVLLGLCTQADLDEAIMKAQMVAERERRVRNMNEEIQDQKA
ncbi:MAG: cell cycle transcriptional regulator TrcR [Anaplasma ovis]